MTVELIARVAKAIEATLGSMIDEDGRRSQEFVDERLSAAASAAIEAMPPFWQPIETAPRDRTPVLLFVEGHVREAVWEGEYYAPNWQKSQVDGNWQLLWAEMNNYGVTPDEPPTHWAPRPEPPPGLKYKD